MLSSISGTLNSRLLYFHHGGIIVGRELKNMAAEWL
jgi:hypothetical protein